MADYVELTKRYTIQSIVFILLFVVLSLVTSYHSIFFGLILGSVISLSNLLSTYFQVKRLGEIAEKGRAKFSLGSLFRFSLVIIAVYIAFQYPGTFHLISVVVGLMLTYIIIIINSLLNLKHL